MGYELQQEKNAKVKAIREYVRDVWQGNGTYAITDYDGTRTALCADQEDLVWEIHSGWWPCDECEKTKEQEV